MTKLSYLDHWYTALRSPAGYCFRVNEGDPTIYRAKLYAARREAMDPQLSTLSVTISPTDEREVWIVHREAPKHGPEESSLEQHQGDLELGPDEL